jgi:hypothetical protein
MTRLSSAIAIAGTWTPTLVGGGTPGTPVYSTQTGYYERIGRLVIARFNMVTTDLGGAAGAMSIGGLPFAVANLSNGRGTVIFGIYSGITFTGSTQLGGDCLPNASIARIISCGTGVSTATVDAAAFAAAVTVEGTIIYSGA